MKSGQNRDEWWNPNIFTVEASLGDEALVQDRDMLLARYVCHLRCRQTDLYKKPSDGDGFFVLQTTPDTSRRESAGRP